jgi:hypothetical protein
MIKNIFNTTPKTNKYKNTDTYKQTCPDCKKPYTG